MMSINIKDVTVEFVDGLIITAFEDGENNSSELENIIKSTTFKGKEGEIFYITELNEKVKYKIFVGLGKKELLNGEVLRNAMAKAAKKAKELKIDNINDSKEIMKKIDELYMTSERSFSGTLITDASSMDADQILEEMYSGITNKEKYSKEDLTSIADKGMRIAEIFMKNARETKELFEESLKGL